MKEETIKTQKMEIQTSNNYMSFEFNDRYYLYEKLANSIHVGSKKEINKIAEIVRKIEYAPLFESASLQKKANAPIDSLVFNVTESCNMSCDYCIYSGKYNNERVTNRKKMTFKTAKKALDLFLFKTPEPSFISFYGGEPTLNFSLIEAIVDYSKKTDPKRKKTFSIATNLLNAQKYIDYLVENQFYIQISLDGPKEVHDKYRLDINKNPTFDRIQENIKKIQFKKEGFTETNVSLSATYKNSEDFSKIVEYFIQVDPEFASMRIGITETKGLKNNNIKSISLEELIKYLQKYISYIKSEKNPPKILRFLFEQSIQDIQNRSQEKVPEKLPLKGACYPGKRKLFIDTGGELYSCEKLIGRLPLGDVYNGINKKSIEKYIVDFTAIRNSLCRSCWAARLCSPCLMFAKDLEKGISKKGLSEICNASKAQIIIGILGYVFIKDFEQERRDDSHFKLNKLN